MFCLLVADILAATELHILDVKSNFDSSRVVHKNEENVQFVFGHNNLMTFTITDLFEP